MPRTPEQIEAQKALEKAVQDHVEAFRSEGTPDVQVVTDWGLVVCLVSYDDEGQRSAYHLGYSNGEMPEHAASGLFSIGKRIAEGTYLEEGKMEE